MTTLAQRNNNPLNIREQSHGVMPWQGETGHNEGFCVFESPKWGFRAAAKILHAYYSRGIDSVDEVIDHWAPPWENDTQAYKVDVADRCGWPLDQIVVLMDPAVLTPLLRAMAIHESGGWDFLDSDLAAGIALAGEHTA